MGNVLGIMLLGLVAILKSTLMPHLRVLGGAPDLMLMMVASWALLAPHTEAFFWAFVGGVAQDLLSGVPLGTSSLALLVVALLANMLQAQLYRSNVVIPLFVTLVGSVVFYLVVMGVLTLTGHAVDWIYTLLNIAAPTVILNLILALPIFVVMTRLYERLNPRLEAL
jgi:rod shape-determining protein MreD